VPVLLLQGIPQAESRQDRTMQITCTGRLWVRLTRASDGAPCISFHTEAGLRVSHYYASTFLSVNGGLRLDTYTSISPSTVKACQAWLREVLA
jgi:hypothetical protein